MNVLIAEDDEITQLILENLLKREGYKTFCAKNGKEAWEIFQKEKINMAIIDWLMPEIDGLELCKKIREAKISRYVYILFLTVREKREDAIKAFDAGADDYVTKPFDPHELLSRIKTGARIVEVDKQLREIQKRLESLSLTDELTGVLNRRGILKRLKEELNRAKREGKSFAVILLDIDNFKKINDVFGHDAGDKVLIETTNRIINNIRPYDLVGRYGGDEFLIGINVKKGDKDLAYKIAKRFFKAISEKSFKIGDKKINLTVSMGINFVKNPSDELQKIIKNADNFLLKAKERGKNKIVMEEI